jgi:hypothetical protein
VYETIVIIKLSKIIFGKISIGGIFGFGNLKIIIILTVINKIIKLIKYKSMKTYPTGIFPTMLISYTFFKSP